MFNIELYIKEITEIYQLNNQDVKKILKFFIGENYNIKIPNSLSEMTNNKNPIINLELPSNHISAHIVGKENPNDNTIQLNIYEFNQSAEVLTKIVSFKICDNNYSQTGRDFYSAIRMEIVDYLYDGSIIYTYIYSSNEKDFPSLYVSNYYYNNTTSQFIGSEAKNIGVFSSLKSYNVFDDLCNIYSGENIYPKEEWIEEILNEYVNGKQKIIEEISNNTKLALGEK